MLGVIKYVSTTNQEPHLTVGNCYKVIALKTEGGGLNSIYTVILDDAGRPFGLTNPINDTTCFQLVAF